MNNIILINQLSRSHVQLGITLHRKSNVYISFGMNVNITVACDDGAHRTFKW